MELIPTGSNDILPQVVSTPSGFNANIVAVALDGVGALVRSWWDGT